MTPLIASTTKRTLGLVVVVLILSSAAFGQTPISWSAPSDGLRLGVRVDQSASVTVILRNTGDANLGILIGTRSQLMLWGFRFTATSPNGDKYEITEIGTEPDPTLQEIFMPINLMHGAHGMAGGLMTPMLIALPAGASHPFIFPLEHLMYLGKGREVSLNNLLRKHFSLSVLFDVEQKNLNGAQMGGIPQPKQGHLWLGELTSTCPRFRTPP